MEFCTKLCAICIKAVDCDALQSHSVHWPALRTKWPSVSSQILLNNGKLILLNIFYLGWLKQCDVEHRRGGSGLLRRLLQVQTRPGSLVPTVQLVHEDTPVLGWVRLTLGSGALYMVGSLSTEHRVFTDKVQRQEDRLKGISSGD